MYRRLILLLLISVSVFAAVVIDRDENGTGSYEAIIDGSPSTVPYNTYIPSLTPDYRMLVDRTDLSKGVDKRLYAGYGMYDVDDSQCRYLAEGYFDETAFMLDFTDKLSYNDHTYYVSQDDMPYDECLELAETYHAHPLVLNTSGEKSMVLNATFQGNVWLGVYKEDCLSTLTSTDREPIIYENFAEAVEPCSGSKLNVFADSSVKKTWHMENENEQMKCVVEFESPYPERPKKVCAPWWKVERSYVDQDFNVSALLKSGQVSLADWDKPKKLSYCAEYDPSYVPPDENATIPHTCVSYQSINGASTCVDDISQPQCYVDECAGYVRNNCTLVADSVPYKDYEKGVILDSAGVEKEVKAKDDKHIYDFRCPVTRGIGAKCIDMQHYVIFPQECPDGKKRYCGTDIPPDIGSDGLVENFKGMCPDGVTQITCPADFRSGVQKVCKEYETITGETLTIEKCHADRKYNIYGFTGGIGESDIYELDENCIRTNSVEDARPHGEALVKTTLKGFGNVEGVLATSAGENKTVLAYENSAYVTEYALNVEQISFAPQNTITSVNNPEACVQLQSDHNGVTIKDLAWKTVDVRSNRINTLIFDKDAYFLKSSNRDVQTCKDDSAAINGEMIRAISAQEDVDRAVTILGVDPNTLPYEETIPKTECVAGYVSSAYGYCAPEDPCPALGYSFSSWLSQGWPTPSSWTARCIDTSGKTVGTSVSCSRVNGISSEWSSCQEPATDCKSGYLDDGHGACTLSQATCVIKVPFGDVGVSQIGPGVRMQLDQDYDRKECAEKSACLSFNVEDFGSFEAPPVKHNCALIRGSESYAPLRDGKGEVYDYEIYSPPPPQVVEPEVITEEEKSKILDIDGARDMLGLDYYTPGPFGYYTTYYSQPFKIDEVKVNDVPIGAELQWPTVHERLLYTMDGVEQIWRSKQADFLPMDMYSSTAAGAILTGVGAPVLWAGLIWNSDIEIFETKYTWTLEREMPTNYTVSPYGYDFRNPNSRGRLTYMEVDRFDSGKFNDDKSGINTLLNSLYTLKYKTMAEMGIDPADIEAIKTPYERAIQGEVEECKWWEYSCEKDNGGYAFSVPETAVTKSTTTYFTGATNRFVVVVPMKGSYKIRALDSAGGVVATRVVIAQDFQQIDSGMFYAQAQFGTDMDIAPGVDENKACATHPMVEWGGGISGIYYEDQMMDGTPIECAKSNDAYVKGASAAKIQVLDMSSNRSVEFTLKGPLPYPNQVFVLSLGEEEYREYKCALPWDSAECLWESEDEQ